MIDASSRGSMLPPVSTTPTRAPGEAVAVRRDGGDPGGAGALDHHLLDLEEAG